MRRDSIAKLCDALFMTVLPNQPFSRYPGGKGWAYQHLINLMPPHERYIESHVGGGAVLRRKRPAASSIAIDLDAAVVKRWVEASIPNLSILNGDAVEILPTLDLGPRDLLYVDPPYLPSSRRTSRYYRHDYAQEDHQRLLALLGKLACMIVVSGYRSPLYDDALANWSRADYLARTHSGIVTESAWTNFQPGPSLHDYSYVGRSFREREAFRRKRTRLARRLITSEPLELAAALSDIAEVRPDVIRAAARRLPS